MFADVKNKRILIICACIALLGIGLIYLTFNYLDTQYLMVCGVNNWDLLTSGRMADFYSDKSEGMLVPLRSGEYVPCDGSTSFLTFLPQMIWCFPIWVTHTFGDNLFVGTAGCVLWYKLLLLISTGLCAYMCYRIVRRLSGDTSSALLSVLIVMASSEVLLSTGYAGQDEIIYVCLALIAIDALMRDKKIAFLIWSVCAVTCCPMILLPIMVAMVLKDKNILRLIGAAIIMMIPTLIWSVCSSGFADKHPTSDHMEELFGLIKIPVMNGQISLMVVAIIVLLFACFIKREATDKQIIWYSTLSLVLLSFLTGSYFYRAMIYIPFLAVLMFADKGRDNTLKILLITILEYARFFALCMGSKVIMNTFFAGRMPWVQSLCERRGSGMHAAYEGFADRFFTYHPSLSGIGPALQGVCAAAILILMWITYSDTNEEKASAHRIPFQNAYLIAYSACIPIYMFMFLHYAMNCI